MEWIVNLPGRLGDEGSYRLWSFLLLSLGLHAAALLLLLWQLPVLPLAGQAETVLSVSLDLTEPAVEPPAKPAAATPPRRREQAVARVETAPAPTPAPPSPAPVPQAAVPPGAGATGAEDAERSAQATRAQVQALLLTDLERHFQYPFLARQRGWQGSVWLSVTIQPDGALHPIRITRSSGYDILDRSAVEAMRRVGSLADAGQWLRGQALELPLPVVYRLTDKR